MIMLKKSRISILPSFLTGIKIRLGGRLFSQKVVPRFTVQTFQEGSLARTKANVVTSSRFTHKNKRGTFSITVSVGQGFFQNREKQVVLVNHVDEVITNYNIINYEPEYDYSLNDFDKTPKQ